MLAKSSITSKVEELFWGEGKEGKRGNRRQRGEHSSPAEGKGTPQGGRKGILITQIKRRRGKEGKKTLLLTEKRKREWLMTTSSRKKLYTTKEARKGTTSWERREKRKGEGKPAQTAREKKEPPLAKGGKTAGNPPCLVRKISTLGN